MKVNRPEIKTFLCCVFSFQLSLLFLALFLLAGLYFGAFNNRVILNKVSESGYYNEIQKELNSRASIIFAESELPAYLLTEVITLERVYTDGRYYMEEVLAGKDPGTNTDKLKDTLKQNIDGYLEENFISPAEELDAGLDGLISRVEQEYKREIEFRFIYYMGEYKTYYRGFVKKAVPVILALTGIISFMLIKMHRYRHRGIRYITYAMITSSCIAGSLACYLLLVKAYDRITVSPEYYSRFLTGYFKWIIQVFLYLSGLGILISVLLIILTGYVKKRIAD